MQVLIISDSSDRPEDVRQFHNDVCDVCAKSSFKFLNVKLCTMDYDLFDDTGDYDET